MKLVVLTPDKINLISTKLKELWQKIELNKDTSIDLHNLSRLKDDFLSADDTHKQHELLLLIHALLLLDKHKALKIDEDCFPIKEQFFYFLNNNSWLGIEISKEEEKLLITIPSVLSNHLTPHDESEWLATKNNVLIWITRAQLDFIAEKISSETPDIKESLDSAINELFELQLNVAGLKDFLKKEHYEKLMAVIYFNTAACHYLLNDFENARKYYQYAVNQDDSLIKNLAELRLEDLKQISKSTKKAHQPYKFRKASAFLKALNEPLKATTNESQEFEPALKLIPQYSPILISISILATAAFFTILVAVLAANFGLALPILVAIGAFLIAPMPSLLVPLIATFGGIMAISALSTALTEIFMPKTSLLTKEVPESPATTTPSSHSSYKATQTILESEEPNVEQQPSMAPTEHHSSVFSQADQIKDTTDEAHRKEIALKIEAHQEEISAKIQEIKDAWPTSFKGKEFNLETYWKRSITQKIPFTNASNLLERTRIFGVSDDDRNKFNLEVLPHIQQYNKLIADQDYKLLLSEQETIEREKTFKNATSGKSH